MLLTWQKLAPLVLCVRVVGVGEAGFLIGLAVANGFAGAIGGLNQTQLRPLLGYSAVVHIG